MLHPIHHITLLGEWARIHHCGERTRIHHIRQLGRGRQRSTLVGHEFNWRLCLFQTGFVVSRVRQDELGPIGLDTVRHLDRASVTRCMLQDLNWQLEWGPRVVSDVCEGPRTSFIQLLQFFSALHDDTIACLSVFSWHRT